MKFADRLLNPKFSASAVRRASRGFSLIELVLVVAVGLIMAAMAVPVISQSLRTFRLRAAISGVSGAIQSTRYRAILDGCRYQIAFNNAANTYQVSSETTGAGCAAAFTNVGGPITFGSPAQVTLSAPFTLQFSPGGSVQATAGSLNFTISSVGSSPNYKSVTVTKYGSIKVQ